MRSYKLVFSSLIAFNGKLTSQCDNLSTHHYHTTYYPCFDMQFCHSQITQHYFCAVAISFKKRESNRAALLYQRDKEKTRKLLWQRLDWQEKGILAKVVKDTKQQLNPAAIVVPGDCVVIILLLPSLPNAFGAASYSSSYLSRLPSSLSPFFSLFRYW